MNAFDLLKPELKTLVKKRFKKPTPVQKEVIPEILKGHNILTISETGSGKTEACLLPVFNLWLKEKPKPISILYITPLRSLNRDLLKRVLWWSQELGFDVSVRHGDTSAYERKMQTENPPDMLISTPETLQSVLVGKKIREHLKNIKYIIIDEVHELVPSKRGLQLSVGLERLKELMKSDAQIIALSATVGSPERVARFFSLDSRPHKIINAIKTKKMRIEVECPKPEPEDAAIKNKVLTGIETAARLRRVIELIHSGKSVLTFTNTREFAEVLSSRIKVMNEQLAIETHHSSLSKEVRITAERNFKENKLKSLICTSSLELGIDIGSIDLVVQYLSPRQVSKLLQRAGRSGHTIEKTSKGIIISSDPDDCFESTAIAYMAAHNRIEPVRCYEKAYDVLAHQIVGLALEKYKITHDDAFEIIRRAYPFRNLSKEDFLETCLLLQKLGILWVHSKFSDVPVLRRRKKAWIYYYGNLSTIPDTKTYQVVDVVSNKPVGSLDAEFVALHGTPGSSFITKGQPWRILSVGKKKIQVEPLKGLHGAIPAWEGELIPVPYDVAQEVGRIRREISELLPKGKKFVIKHLMEKYPVTKEVAETLCGTIKKQKNWGTVPDEKAILFERFSDGKEVWVVIHTCWGSLVNETIGRVISSLVAKRVGSVGVQTDPYRIVFKLQRLGDWKDVFLVLKNLRPEDIKEVLNEELPRTELFAWKFIHVAKRFGIISRDAEYGKAYIRKVIDAYRGSPVFREALNEIYQENLDVEKSTEVLKELGKKKIITEPGLSPLGEAGIVRKYEIFAPEKPEREIFHIFKKRLLETRVGLVCVHCGKWATIQEAGEVPEKIRCPLCEAGFVSVVPSKYVLGAQELAKKALSGKRLSKEEEKHWKYMEDTASLVISSGKNAVLCLAGKGIGPRTAGRILEKMLKGDDLLREILEEEKKYARTRGFWKS